MTPIPSIRDIIITVFAALVFIGLFVATPGV